MTDETRRIIYGDDGISGVVGSMKRMEGQIDRIVAEIESEKGTRTRIHSNFDGRLSRTEKIVWVGIGMAVSANFFTATALGILAILGSK